MTDNKKLILKEIKQHRNEIVLMGYTDLVKLLDFYEDKEDYYYVVVDLHGKEAHWSCVIGFIPIKVYFTKEVYQRIEHLFEINLEWHDFEYKKDLI